ncbi:hypothetical protein GCM10007160_18060 [Litchfieldella qijiaojingensis]|uniref:Endonuclease I n=1 Tax=Litchfieldella qijiaojingensis TaxID=980347 RepID=A0ABQ2YS19_9GAMM|nr:endodeoxyribonuclease [Halomonas qijiaojingensis]GGX90985.1 hypothetical protein GCM10007160_18060 [Halomonas qijiaojingensis]
MRQINRKTSRKSAKQIGLRHGFRSGLEEAVADDLKKSGVEAEYEKHKIHFTYPPRKAKYTPDFVLPNGIIIETKGRFVVADRKKHLIIQEQHPDLDIRFVFSNSRNKISKGSKTTYAAWCNKHGFQYHDRIIPKEWKEEKPCKKRLRALEEAGIV